MNPMLTERFSRAMNLSFDLHKDQIRKSTNNIPYFSHIMSVTALVQEAGADEDTQIAALLHDAVEDQGGEEVLQLIRDQFGDSVADIVLFCSDSVERNENGEKKPWRERKETHLNHLKALSRSTGLTTEQKNGVLIMIADKLHNALTTYEAVIEHGDAVYERFRGGKNGMLWYLRSCANILTQLYGDFSITRRLNAAVSALENFKQYRKFLHLTIPGIDESYFYDASDPIMENEAKKRIATMLIREEYFEMYDDETLAKLRARVHERELAFKTYDALPDFCKEYISKDENLDELEFYTEMTQRLRAFTRGDHNSANELLKFLRDNEMIELCELYVANPIEGSPDDESEEDDFDEE
jgi:hypothetical protein